MDASVWLRIEGKKKYGRWACGTVMSSKTKPSTKENEIAIKLTVTIPDDVFEEPVYEAKLSLPDVGRKFPSKTEVARHVSESLSKEMGFKVKLTMEEAGKTFTDSLKEL